MAWHCHCIWAKPVTSTTRVPAFPTACPKFSLCQRLWRACAHKQAAAERCRSFEPEGARALSKCAEGRGSSCCRGAAAAGSCGAAGVQLLRRRGRCRCGGHGYGRLWACDRVDAGARVHRRRRPPARKIERRQRGDLCADPSRAHSHARALLPLENPRPAPAPPRRPPSCNCRRRRQRTACGRALPHRGRAFAARRPTPHHHAPSSASRLRSA